MSNKKVKDDISEEKYLEDITAVKDTDKGSRENPKADDITKGLEVTLKADAEEKSEKGASDENKPVTQELPAETFYASFDTGYKLDYDKLFSYMESMNMARGFITYSDDESSKASSESSHDVEKGFDCKVMDNFIRVSRMDALMGVTNGFIDPMVRERHAILSKTSMYAALLMVKYTLFSS